MRPSNRLSVALVFAMTPLVGACGGGSDGDGNTMEATGSGDSGGDPDTPPTSSLDIGAWIGEGTYLEWEAESGPHASAGPHFGGVRTFVNPVLFDSLTAGNATHPVGAASVKELYGDGSIVRGWAVMVKTADGTGGDTWWWYEEFEGNQLVAGNDVPVCVDCHGAGTDFVLTPFPLQ